MRNVEIVLYAVVRNRDRNFIAPDSAVYKYFAWPGIESGRPRPTQIGRDSLNELQGGGCRIEEGGEFVPLRRAAPYSHREKGKGEIPISNL